MVETYVSATGYIREAARVELHLMNAANVCKSGPDAIATRPMAFLLCITLATIISAQGAPDRESWPFWGGSLGNTHQAVAAAYTNWSTVGDLRVVFNTTVDGWQSAIPTVVNDSLIFPTWAGWVYSLDKLKGTLLWRQAVGSWKASPLCPKALITGTTPFSRSSPAVAGNNGDILILGIKGTSPYVMGAHMLLSLVNIWIHMHAVILIAACMIVYLN